MVALLVAMSIMGVMLTVAMPVWHQMAQREKEAELIFRGQQYARAIGIFQRRAGPGALPPTLDVLVEQRFLRKKYKDPITGEDFLPLISGQPVPGTNPAARVNTVRQPDRRARCAPPTAAGPGAVRVVTGDRERIRPTADRQGRHLATPGSDGRCRWHPGRREQEQSEIHPAL